MRGGRGAAGIRPNDPLPARPSAAAPSPASGRGERRAWGGLHRFRSRLSATVSAIKENRKCSNAATALSSPPSISRAASRPARLTPEAMVDLCAAAIAAREDEVGAFTHLDIDAARQLARTDADAPARPAAARAPGRHEGHLRHADMPTEYGSAAYKGHRPASDAAAVAHDAPRRRRHARQDRDDRVRPPAARQDAQPAQSRAHAGRLVLRLGGRGRGRHGADRDRLADRRLGDPPRRLLRRRGLQAVLQAAADRRDEVLLVVARHGRAVTARASPTSRSRPPRWFGRDLRVDRATPAAPRVALLRTHIWAEASADMQNAVETTARALEAAGASVKDAAMPPLLEDAWRAHR